MSVVGAFATVRQIMPADDRYRVLCAYPEEDGRVTLAWFPIIAWAVVEYEPEKGDGPFTSSAVVPIYWNEECSHEAVASIDDEWFRDYPLDTRYSGG